MQDGTAKVRENFQKGSRGQRGIPGPPGPAGITGPEGARGEAGARGTEGPRGYTGLTGAIGPAGRAGSFKEMAKQIQYIDRSIENIYNEMGSHIARMTQLQRELDTLRGTVRQLAARSAK